MAERNTTTTTTEDQNQEDTTTTTTVTVSTTEVPTGDRASVNHPGGDASPAATRQGEVAIDQDAKTDVVGGDPRKFDKDTDANTNAENIENAKQDALRNAARETQPEPRETGQSDRAGKGVK